VKVACFDGRVERALAAFDKEECDKTSGAVYIFDCDEVFAAIDLKLAESRYRSAAI
jgi:hypothetical protein